MLNEQMPYTYEKLKRDIIKLKSDHPEIEVGSIGRSVWGKELFYIRLGRGPNKIMYNGAHHGMEWLTAEMLMIFAGDFLASLKDGSTICGFNLGALAKKTSLYIVPMVNPDGVRLAALGLPNRLTVYERQRLLRINGSDDFSRWQANARGVDLNHNYDAMWSKSKELESKYGIYSPGPTRFSGRCPESEPESHALAQFTRQQNFNLTIAFHSQGKVIYHGFLGKEPPKSLEIAKAFTKISPYIIDNTEGIASYGGFKDWFVHRFNRPGFTVEIGTGQNPLPRTQLQKVYSETLPILLGAMTVDAGKGLQ